MLFFIYLLLIFFDINTAQKSIFEGIEKTEIIVLNETNFDNYMQNGLNKTWFIMFYSSWCPHCQKIFPILQELAQNLSMDPIKYAIIDWYFILFYSKFYLYKLNFIVKKTLCLKIDFR